MEYAAAPFAFLRSAMIAVRSEYSGKPRTKYKGVGTNTVTFIICISVWAALRGAKKNRKIQKKTHKFTLCRRPDSLTALSRDVSDEFIARHSSIVTSLLVTGLISVSDARFFFSRTAQTKKISAPIRLHQPTSSKVTLDLLVHCGTAPSGKLRRPTSAPQRIRREIGGS